MNIKRISCIVSLLLIILITACEAAQTTEIITSEDPENKDAEVQPLIEEDEIADQEEPSIPEDVEGSMDTQTNTSDQNAMELIEIHGIEWVNDFAWSPDGNTIALHTLSDVRLIDIHTYIDKYTYEEIVLGPGDDFPMTGQLITFSPDGKILAVSYGEEVIVYDIESQQALFTWDDFEVENYEYPIFAYGIAFSPEGDYLAAGLGGFWGLTPGSIRIWDVASGSLLQEFGNGNQPAIHDLTFNKEGNLLGTIDGKGQVCIWNFLDGTKVLTFAGSRKWWFDYGDGRAIAFSPDGRLLAAGGRSDWSGYDPELHLFDSSSGDLIFDLERHQSQISSVAFNKDGNLLASASMDDTVRLWDVQTGEQLAVLDIPGASSVGFSPDGTLLATAGWGDVLRLWRVPEETTGAASIMEEPEVEEPIIEDKQVAGVGDQMTNSVDGASMVYVPEGEFLMGTDHGWETDGVKCDGPEHTVYLDAFWIYQHEVTNDEYRACVDSGGCTAPDTVTYYSDPAYNDHPVVHVDWFDANSYCLWAGGRLPTDAEWEKAARGTDGREYPWGNQKPTCNLANYKDCVGGTSPVGSYPSGASPFGVLDMAGNVGEWVADWYEDGYYSRSPDKNPTGPENGTHKSIRSASWDMPWGWLPTSTRVVFIPSNELGFRCVVEP